MTSLKLWSEGNEITESGVEIGGIQVAWGKKWVPAKDRATALDVGLTPDLCDDFEVNHRYQRPALLAVDGSGRADPPVGPSLRRTRLLRILAVSLSTCCVVKLICYNIITYYQCIASRPQTSTVKLVEILTPGPRPK